VLTSPLLHRRSICRVERYIIKLIQPGNFNDQLTEILSQWGAVLCWPRAGRAEVADFLGTCRFEDCTATSAVVRTSPSGARVMTDSSVAVRQPRVLDREADAYRPWTASVLSVDPGLLTAPLEIDLDAACRSFSLKGIFDRRLL